MTALLARLPGRTKTAAVEHAIAAFVSGESVDRLRALAGKLDIEDVSRELRDLDRTG